MNLLIPAVTSTQPLSIFQNQERRVFFWWLPFHAVSSLYLIFSILVRRCFASLYKRQWPIFIVSWIHFFSRMAPGLDKLMWLLTINITHLFQKMSSFVSEIDTKIFCRIIFRQNDAHFFVHNWKKKIWKRSKNACNGNDLFWLTDVHLELN